MPGHKLGVVVPYRNREKQLRQFLLTVPKYLQREGIDDFEIIVAEQMDRESFNRGALLNAGFLAAQKRGCDYVVFHDVDLLPLYVDYSYSAIPLELVGKIIDTTLESGFQVSVGSYLNDDYFGGVTLFPSNLFEKINGYSNRYIGWGFEDNDLLCRCEEAQIPLDSKQYRQYSHLQAGLQFNGEDSYVEISNDFRSFKSDKSILVTFKIDDLQTDMSRIGDECSIFSVPGFDMALSYDNYGTYKFEVYDNYKDVYTIRTKKLPVGITCQAIITYDAANRKLVFYFNGQEIDYILIPEDRELRTYSRSLYLGAGAPMREEQPKYMRGLISDFATFDRALTPIEVWHLFGESYLGLGKYNPARWYSAHTLVDKNTLPNLVGDVNTLATVHNCTVEPMLGIEYFYKMVIPYKRPCKFSCQPHLTNGDIRGYWKDWATRLNQVRHKSTYAFGSKKAIDGLSTVNGAFRIVEEETEKYVHVQVTSRRSNEIRGMRALQKQGRTSS